MTEQSTPPEQRLPEPAQPDPSATPSATLPTQPPTRPDDRGGWIRSPIGWVVSMALAALVGTALFVGGYLAAGGQGAGSCAAPTEAFIPFCEAYDRLHEQFVDKLDDEQLVEGAIEGMFQYGVQDPFSGYMPPEQFQSALSDLSGTFSGIGAEVGVRNLENPDDLSACTSLSDTCVLVVVAPLEGSPAEASGLQPEDVITHVDGESVDGSTLQAEVEKIRGESGTDVTLSLRRGERTFDLTITRAEIQMREVTSRMLDDGETGYVALHGFTDAASEQFHDALVELVDDGATAIVFDLRNNPGGYIEAARKVASEFLDAGVVFTQESANDQVKEWEATSGGAVTDLRIPVIVLVNGGSASASEIVTAALKEHERATIIGQPTYGKNTVQLWTELENGGGVRITISRWFTPRHNSVAPDGVQPDVAVEVPDNVPSDQDPFLDAAVDYLASHSIGREAEATVAPSPTSAIEQLSAWAPVSYDPGGRTAARV